MEQYKTEGTVDVPPAKSITVTDESRHIHKIESTVKNLQETVNLQQQEISRLHREIIRLKHGIDDVIAVVRNRG
jgi:predicted RNase H-like nuclease (RuvC/YqgF family)